MASHTVHEDIATHGLADGCPRCAQHAEHPFTSLDDANLRALALRVKQDEWPRSLTERLAMRYVDDVVRNARTLQRLGIEI